MRVRFDDGDTPQPLHEINVTPFIDVMLVLLIVFMIAAPLATVDVNVDLPASTAPAASRGDRPVWVTVGPDLALHVGDVPVHLPAERAAAPGVTDPAGVPAAAALASALDAATGGDRQLRIHLRADRAVAYGDLMGVMNALRAAGYARIALVGLDAGAPPAGQ